ncbi:MAG: hypothetical protein ACTS6G_03590 [Candidatus Hodgkinia cicadicola]
MKETLNDREMEDDVVSTKWEAATAVVRFETNCKWRPLRLPKFILNVKDLSFADLHAAAVTRTLSLLRFYVPTTMVGVLFVF